MMLLKVKSTKQSIQINNNHLPEVIQKKLSLQHLSSVFYLPSAKHLSLHGQPFVTLTAAGSGFFLFDLLCTFFHFQNKLPKLLLLSLEFGA